MIGKIEYMKWFGLIFALLGGCILFSPVVCLFNGYGFAGVRTNACVGFTKSEAVSGVVLLFCGIGLVTLAKYVRGEFKKM